MTVSVRLITDVADTTQRASLRQHVEAVCSNATVHETSLQDLLIENREDHRTEIDWYWIELESSQQIVRERINAGGGQGQRILVSQQGMKVAPGSSIYSHAIAMPPDCSPLMQAAVFNTLCCLHTQCAPIRDENRILRKQLNGVASHVEEMNKEMHRAAQIQQCIQRHDPPHVEGLDVDVLYLPAGSVSGDAYCMQQLNAQYTAFYLADAAGHGMSAALLTMFIDQILWRYMQEMEGDLSESPRHVLAAVNREMVQRQTTRPLLATAIVGILHLPTGTAQIARAGHPPALHLAADGKHALLTPGGPLLGAIETDEFDCETIVMRKNDRLLLFTDGFEVAFPHLPNDSHDEYCDELARICVENPKGSLDAVHKQLNAEAGSFHQRDDITAMLIQYTGISNTAVKNRTHAAA